MDQHYNQQPVPPNQLPITALVPLQTQPFAPSQAISYPSSAYYANEQEDSNHGGLLEYWYILRRYKGTVILVTFLGTLLGYLSILPQTPVYQARVSMEIENLNQNFMNMKDANPTQATGSGGETSDIQTQIRILQSESLIERVINKLKTTPMSTLEPESRLSVWKKALNLPVEAPKDAYQQSLNMAAKAIKVRAAGQTRIIEITADSTSPGTAAEFANTLATEYIDQNLESRWKTTQKTTDWLTRQIDDMRVKLERSEDRLQHYAQAAGLIFTSDKGSVSDEKLRQVQESLSAAEADRIAKQSRWEIANSAPPESLPDVLNDSGLRDYQAKLTDLKRQIAELSSTYTPEYQKVKRAEAQYSILQAAFERERGAILKRIRNDYDESVRKERLLAAGYSSQAKLVSGEGERAIQYNILKREVDSNRSLYDTMLQQLKQATITAALRANNVRVVDPAKVPSHPYKPDATQSSLIGLLAGLFGGAAFVIMRDRADRSIREPGETAQFLNCPELGVIPNGVTTSRMRFGAGNSLKSDTASMDLVTWKQKPSAVAEAYRTTLVSILFSSQNGSRPRVLLVTSAAPGEGKTTTATNLAVAISEVGQRVLLIDGDLRKPRLADILGCDNSPGLSEVLRERDLEKAKEEMANSIRETEIPGLYLLPSGKSTSAASSLLYNATLSPLLNDLRTKFDTIVIDSPPMLQLPDARMLGRVSDKVLLVLRANKTTRDAALAAAQKFKQDGTSIMGTVLNDWNPSLSHYGYYGYYRRYYRDYASYYHVDKAS